MLHLHGLAMIGFSGAVLAAMAYGQATTAPTVGINVIPKPVRVELGTGSFPIASTTSILVEKGLARGMQIGGYFADALARSAGMKLKVAETDAEAQVAGAIVLTTRRPKAGLGDEGYELEITTDGVVIRAPKEAGLYYGMQTLLQLLPPEVYSRTQVAKAMVWALPCVKIEDQPRFVWRGLLLDTARHMFSKQEIFDFIDVMAMHKLNTMHWHINDDVGWRIEIKKYPKLVEVGAWRPDIMFGLDPNSSTFYGKDGRYGGFFTQQDVKEIVAYAADHFITVVPEFEMPAHSEASRRAYPELSCDDPPAAPGEAPKPQPKLAYCAGKDSTFQMLDDILTEACALFPSPVIHIGGDECDKASWKACPKCQARIKAEGLKDEKELQAYFVHRIEKILNSKGKRMMGWSEIQEGGIAPNAMLMDWIGGGLQAARGGHDVVMTPMAHCYLDFYQAKGPEPKAIGGYVPLEAVYAFDPVPAQLEPEYVKHILGVQGNLWAEFIPNYRHLQYMAYPRGCAIAEVGWTPAASKDWADFQVRLKVHSARLTARGVNYRGPSRYTQVGTWTPEQMSEQFKVMEWDVTKLITDSATFGFTFWYERGEARLEIEWAALLENGQEIGRDAHAGATGAENKHNEYRLNLPKRDANAKYVLRASVRSAGGTDSHGGIWLSH